MRFLVSEGVNGLIETRAPEVSLPIKAFVRLLFTGLATVTILTPIQRTVFALVTRTNEAKLVDVSFPYA